MRKRNCLISSDFDQGYGYCYCRAWVEWLILLIRLPGFYFGLAAAVRCIHLTSHSELQTFMISGESPDLAAGEERSVQVKQNPAVMEQMDREGPIFRDIRRYYCEYCGICRSKKSLITSHVLAHHKDKIEDDKDDNNEEEEVKKSNTCEECGASFKKPAYLKQHMQGHSLEWML